MVGQGQLLFIISSLNYLILWLYAHITLLKIKFLNILTNWVMTIKNWRLGPLGGSVVERLPWLRSWSGSLGVEFCIRLPSRSLLLPLLVSLPLSLCVSHEWINKIFKQQQKSIGCSTKVLEFKLWLYHLLAVWQWASYLNVWAPGFPLIR